MKLTWLVLVLAACTSEGKPPPKVVAPPQTDPAAQDYPMPALPRAKVTLSDAYKGVHVVEVEVCANGISRSRGMMWRTELAPGKGMLFIFTAEQPLSFWMKNTLIPLDMIFISKQLKVTGVVMDAEPKTLSSRGVGTPSLYVLEVPGGWAKKVGIEVGNEVRMDGIVPIEVTP